MGDPVTVFMLVVAGLLVVGTVGEQVFARTGVPTVIWLIALGVLVRVAGIVPLAVVTTLAPFFAALALVIVLFNAGTNLAGGTGDSNPGFALDAVARKRAKLLAFVGFAVIATLVALFSQALHGLDILPTWSWAHAFMLGSLVGCGASEVFLPSLPGVSAGDEATAILRRESAITKALAVTGTVLCLDLLSPRIATGGAGLAMAAGFGFALAFGSVAGLLWVIALQRLTADDTRNYGFTLAVMVVLYVLSESAGGSGPLSVLVFGAVLGNAGVVLRLLRQRSNNHGDNPDDPGEAVRAALGGHDRTVGFVRTLVFAMVGLTLAPPWGPLVMGVALAFIILVSRLAVARFALVGLEQRARNIVGTCAPRGMATIALVTLPLAHAVPGAREMVALVFSAVTTSVLLFTVGMYEQRRGQHPAADRVARPPNTSLAARVAADVAASHPVASSSGATSTAFVGPIARVVTPIAPTTPTATPLVSSIAAPIAAPVAAPIAAPVATPVVRVTTPTTLVAPPIDTTPGPAPVAAPTPTADPPTRATASDTAAAAPTVTRSGGPEGGRELLPEPVAASDDHSPPTAPHKPDDRPSALRRDEEDALSVLARLGMRDDDEAVHKDESA